MGSILGRRGFDAGDAGPLRVDRFEHVDIKFLSGRDADVISIFLDVLQCALRVKFEHVARTLAHTVRDRTGDRRAKRSLRAILRATRETAESSGSEHLQLL